MLIRTYVNESICNFFFSVAFTKSVGMGWVFVVVVNPFSQGDIPNE